MLRGKFNEILSDNEGGCNHWGRGCVASYMPSPAFLPCSIPQKIVDESVYNLRSLRSSLSDFKLNKLANLSGKPEG